MQDNLQSNECIATLNERWNKNVLVMGDFNDQPFDKSIMNHLYVTPNAEAMKEWRCIFEFLNKDFYARERQNDKQKYLQYPPYLYNCMWKLIPDGTNYIYHFERIVLWQTEVEDGSRSHYNKGTRWSAYVI
jgi:hypothetical protein